MKLIWKCYCVCVCVLMSASVYVWYSLSIGTFSKSLRQCPTFNKFLVLRHFRFFILSYIHFFPFPSLILLSAFRLCFLMKWKIIIKILSLHFFPCDIQIKLIWLWTTKLETANANFKHVRRWSGTKKFYSFFHSCSFVWMRGGAFGEGK